MLRELLTREDKTADRGRVEERGYNPMPAGWKPPARVHPVHEAGRPPQARRPNDPPPAPASDNRD